MAQVLCLWQGKVKQTQGLCANPFLHPVCMWNSNFFLAFPSIGVLCILLHDKKIALEVTPPSLHKCKCFIRGSNNQHLLLTWLKLIIVCKIIFSTSYFQYFFLISLLANVLFLLNALFFYSYFCFSVLCFLFMAWYSATEHCIIQERAAFLFSQTEPQEITAERYFESGFIHR